MECYITDGQLIVKETSDDGSGWICTEYDSGIWGLAILNSNTNPVDSGFEFKTLVDALEFSHSF